MIVNLARLFSSIGGGSQVTTTMRSIGSQLSSTSVGRGFMSSTGLNKLMETKQPGVLMLLNKVFQSRASASNDALETLLHRMATIRLGIGYLGQSFYIRRPTSVVIANYWSARREFYAITGNSSKRWKFRRSQAEYRQMRLARRVVDRIVHLKYHVEQLQIVQPLRVWEITAELVTFAAPVISQQGGIAPYVDPLNAIIYKLSRYVMAFDNPNLAPLVSETLGIAKEVDPNLFVYIDRDLKKVPFFYLREWYIAVANFMQKYAPDKLPMHYNVTLQTELDDETM